MPSASLWCDPVYINQTKILDEKIVLFCNFLRTAGMPMTFDIEYICKIFDIQSDNGVPVYIREIIADEGIRMRKVTNLPKYTFDFL